MDKVPFPLCCGIGIIIDMGDTVPRSNKHLQKLMKDHFTIGRLNLIALNHSQQEVYEEFLHDNGWTLMSRHRNGAHYGGFNYLWGYHPSGFDNYGDVVEVEGRPEVRPVELEIYANLRDFGRRGPFSGIKEAKIAYPLCRQFDRREIMSNGTTVWVNAVATETVEVVSND